MSVKLDLRKALEFCKFLPSPSELLATKVTAAFGNSEDELRAALGVVAEAIAAGWVPGGRVLVPLASNDWSPELAAWVGATCALRGWRWWIAPLEGAAGFLELGALVLYLEEQREGAS